jgi:hypothetical protein
MEHPGRKRDIDGALMSLPEARASRVREARMIFEKMLTYANHRALDR